MSLSSSIACSGTGGVPFLTIRTATRASTTASSRSTHEHDQERKPPVEDDRERRSGGRQTEGHREEEDDAGEDRQPRPGPERGHLALHLGARELLLELRQRAERAE